MDWINRFIDQPLLHGAASALRAWHAGTGQPPERLEPVWNMVVISLLGIGGLQLLQGAVLPFAMGALVMLALPSALKLRASAKAGKGGYGARQYKALVARASLKRDGEWSVRMTVLVAAAALPFVAHADDPAAARFLLGATIWFVLTGPLKFYLDAAEPPQPGDGDRAFKGNLRFQ